jgi:hypothetical protein
MKLILLLAATATSLFISTGAFAQQASNPVTREQVKAELAQLEKEGYNPRDWYHYPDNIEEAQRRVDAQRDKSAATPTQ